MYVETAGGLTKIIGQIAEFNRTGSLLVSSATAGIKTRKKNVQLLGPHAQTIVSSQPVSYFVPAKQEADAGVNAGDLILIRLEEKLERREFEIAASGAWRSSSGISLTHQIQLLRSEVKSGVYKVAPATALSKGEYALYLSRGEGMAPYVYDFGVQEISAATAKEAVAKEPVAKERTMDHRTSQRSAADFSSKDQAAPSVTAPVQVFKDATIGVFCDGNPDVRHAAVESLDSLDDESAIYAAEPWTETSDAITVAEPDGRFPEPQAGVAGLRYFLEVSIARDFLDG